MPRKIVISPSQALLILIEHYANDPDKVEVLKGYYLCGANNQQDDIVIRKLLTDIVLNSYEVDYSSSTIDEDPTRRYFETHLTYQHIQPSVEKLEIKDLQKHLNNLMELAQSSPSYGEFENLIKAVLMGDEKKLPSKSFFVPHIEYLYIINNLKNKTILPSFDNETREKVYILVGCSYLAGVIASLITDLPIDIYGKGIYSSERRGKVPKQQEGSTRNSNMGLLKGHMLLFKNDIAFAPDIVPQFVKPSESSTYDPNADWVKYNFTKLVHPFSNSISGTLLCQLRVLAKLKEDNKETIRTKEQIELYFKALISAMIYFSGGHSIFEFTYPLQLPAVKQAFKYIKDFDSITMESMYYHGDQKQIFNQIINQTISYNNYILSKYAINYQIVGNSRLQFTKEPVPALNYLTLQQKINKLEEERTHCIKKVSICIENCKQNIQNIFNIFSKDINNLAIEMLCDIKKCLDCNDINDAYEKFLELKNKKVSKNITNYINALEENICILQEKYQSLESWKNKNSDWLTVKI